MKKNAHGFYLEPEALELGDYLIMPSPGRYVRVTLYDLVPKGRFARIRLSNGHEQIWRKDRFCAERPQPENGPEAA